MRFLGPQLLALLVAMSCGDPSATPPPPGPKVVPPPARRVCKDCNLLLISLDTLRRDHLGCYGYERDTSPHIDALASRSTVFEEATSQSNWTLPSHMSIMTGLYPSHHGVVLPRHKLPDETTTLADLLSRAGYRSVAFTGGSYVGKQHNYHGFESHDSGGGFSGRNFAKTLEWIEANAGDRFFLFWHDYTPHCPYSTARKHDRFVDPEYTGPVDVKPNREEPLCAEKPHWGCWNKCQRYFAQILGLMKPADHQHVIDKYDGEILLADTRVGKLIAALEEAGVAKRTVVVLTSDHGESLADREQRRAYGHSSLLYQELLGVPLVVHVPGKGPGRDPRLVESIDIMPTVLGALGLPIPDGLDGRDLLDNGDAATPPVAYSELHNRIEAVALRRANHKLIFWGDERQFELFDLAADPHEQRDLFGGNHPAENQLMRLLSKRRLQPRDNPTKVEMSDDLVMQLRALGYL